MKMLRLDLLADVANHQSSTNCLPNFFTSVVRHQFSLNSLFVHSLFPCSIAFLQLFVSSFPVFLFFLFFFPTSPLPQTRRFSPRLAHIQQYTVPLDHHKNHVPECIIGRKGEGGLIRALSQLDQRDGKESSARHYSLPLLSFFFFRGIDDPP